MKKNKLIFLLVAILGIWQGKGQTAFTFSTLSSPSGSIVPTTSATTTTSWTCGFNQQLRNSILSKPVKKLQLEDYENRLKYKLGLPLPPPASGPYVIPVVFHVIDAAGSPSGLTYKNILWQLAAMNAAFGNTYSTMYGFSSGAYSTNTQISFCLAKNIPAGTTSWTNPSEIGVMRYTTSNPSILGQVAGDPISQAALLSLTHPTSAYFPFDKYLNIWVVPNICPTTTCSPTGFPSVVGYATFPSLSPTFDGLVMRNDAIGDNTLPCNNFSSLFYGTDKGRILCHELGHYLGLYHTHESAPSFSIAGCYGTTLPTSVTDGDLISDTPPTSNGGFVGPPNPSNNTCAEMYAPYLANYSISTPNVIDQVENYMSYNDDDYMNTFTADQTYRMWGCLDVSAGPGLRANLVTSSNLAYTGVSTAPACGPGIDDFCFTYTVMNSTCLGAVVNFFAPSGSSFPVTYHWNFGDGTTSTAISPSHTYTSATTNMTVTLTTTNIFTGAIHTSTQIIPFSTNAVSIIPTSNLVTCKGSEAGVNIVFNGLINQVLLSVNGNTVTINKPNNADNFSLVYTICQNTTFTLLNACNSTSTTVTFSVVECGANLAFNGNFSLGNTGFTSDYGNSGGVGPGCYNISNIPVTALMPNATGNALAIDGMSTSSICSSAYNVAANCSICAPPDYRRIDWQQTISGLLPNTTYFGKFKASKSHPAFIYPGYAINQVFLEMRLVAPTSTLMTSGEIKLKATNTWYISGSYEYSVYSYTFTTPPIVSPTYSFQINQVKSFHFYAYDYFIDNVELRQMNTPTLQATFSPSIICAGSSATLTATGDWSATQFTWLPSALTGSQVVVNPLSATIFTVTGNDVCVCTATMAVSVYPPSVLSLTVSPTQIICLGASKTLTITSNLPTTTYTWLPSGLTGSVITINPSATTIYTVIANANKPCTLNANQTLTVQVNVIPTPTLVASANQTICLGTSVNLTASGATNYTWTPCVGSGCNGSAYNVAPTITTIYTVTAQNAGCSTVVTKTISVTVVSPLSLSISATSTVLCAGSSATLTATGASSYTWQPGGSTTNPFVVSPTTPTTYTVSSSNVCGVRTKTISISPNTIPLCCVPTHTTFGTSATSTVALSGTYSGLTINITGVVTINANTSFNNCTLRMAPNSKIEVNPYTTLTFNSSKVFCCSNLWWGIELKKINNGSVSIAGNVQLLRSTVEDMYYGIFVDWLGMTASSGGNILVNQSLLNKNYASIQVLNCNVYQSATTKYPLSITQSTISSNPTVNSPLTTLKPSTSYPYAYTNVNGNGVPYVSFPRSYMGINIWSHNQSPILIGDSLGVNLTNTFDHVDIGIAINRSNVLVHNNEFKNLTGSTYLPYSTASAANEIGVGVKATAMVGKKLQVGTSASVPNTTTTFPKSNLFTNCNKGVLVINSDNVVVKGNKFNCTATSVLPLNCFGCPSPLYNYLQGQSGVWLSGTQGKATISFNACNNINNGIFVSHIVNAPTTSKIVVNNNAINAPLANGYCKQAITLEQLSTYTVTSNYISVANNTLSTVYNGIVVNSVKGGLTITNNPLISVERNKTFGIGGTPASIANYTRTGIKLTNCFGATVANNPNINSAGTAAITAANYNILIGVFYTNSFGGQVNCNTVSNTGQCFVFKAYCKNSWFANNMKTSYQGLVLSNSGFIGQQGAPNGTQNLSTNTWAGITNAETYVVSTPNVNTGATSSPLYVKANTSLAVHTTPTLNLSALTGQQYVIAASFGIRVTTGTVKTCGAATGGGGGGAVVVAMGDVMLGGSISTLGTLGGGALLPQQRCDQLLAFYLTNPNYAFTSADIQDLQSMASQCVLAGDYVVQARCLLNVIFGYVLDFDDVCVSTSRMALAESDPLPAEPQHLAHFNLYPNPNNGTMQLDYELTSCENCQLVIYDVLGKVISTYKLTETIGTLQINETQLGQGVYFYSINQNDMSIYKNKFSIFK